MNVDFTIKYKTICIWGGSEFQAQEEACLSFDKKDYIAWKRVFT